MDLNLKSFDTLILDLGGVILDIDYNLSVEAFQTLGFKNFDAMYSQAKQSGVFDALETGNLSEKEFVKWAQGHIPAVRYEQVISAWNAIIIGFRDGRIETLTKLRRQFKLILLSNTNAIHLNYFNHVLQEHCGASSLHPFFDAVYLSHEVGLRKPDPAIFQKIIDEQSLKQSKVLFIDDSVQHIHSANSIDLPAYHLQFPETLEDLFAPILAKFNE